MVVLRTHKVVSLLWKSGEQPVTPTSAMRRGWAVPLSGEARRMTYGFRGPGGSAFLTQDPDRPTPLHHAGQGEFAIGLRSTM